MSGTLKLTIHSSEGHNNPLEIPLLISQLARKYQTAVGPHVSSPQAIREIFVHPYDHDEMCKSLGMSVEKTAWGTQPSTYIIGGVPCRIATWVPKGAFAYVLDRPPELECYATPDDPTKPAYEPAE